MERWQAFLTELFMYESIEKIEGGYHVRIRTDRGRLFTANLPGKHVTVHPDTRQIEIQHWLAAKIGLVEPLNEKPKGPPPCRPAFMNS